MSTATLEKPTATTASDTILSLNNIEVIYDHVVLVLKGVSLTVPRQGIVATVSYTHLDVYKRQPSLQ